MEILTTVDEARRHVMNARFQGQTVALVPTMGALHDGHLSLVRSGQSKCGRVIATIFVNPTQFGPSEDLQSYPRMLDADLDQLRAAGVDAVFVPTAEVMYPSGFSTHIGEPDVAKPLEGEFRPGHFRGVMTVVMKFFQILPADVAIFGQKDFQQFAVIRAMVRDLDVGIDLIAAPIIRESDGLAMSSRNRYLSKDERQTSLRISRALNDAVNSIRAGEDDASTLESRLHQTLTQPIDHIAPVDSVDYAVLRDANTLEPVRKVSAQETVALIAARVGSTRLIDNAVLTF